MQGRLLRVVDLTPEQWAAWRDLEDHAADPNPFLGPDCGVAAARNYPDGGEMYLAVAEEAGQFYAAVTLQAARSRNDRRPLSYLERVLPTATTQVRRTRHNLTLLVREERAPEALVALLSAVRDTRTPRAFQLLRFETMNGDGPAAAALLSAAHELGLETLELERWDRAFHDDRVESPEAVAAAAATQRRRIKELRKPLEKHLGVPVTMEDRTNQPDIIEELFRLERTGYKFREGIAVECFPGEADWLRTYYAAMRDRGLARCWTLEAEGRILAIDLYFGSQDRLFYVHRAYDEAVRKFRPGRLLSHLFFDDFEAQSQFRDLDSCTKPTDPFTYRQYNTMRPMMTVVVAVGGTRASWSLRLFGALRRTLLQRRARTAETSPKETP